jgi:hypothetical protein
MTDFPNTLDRATVTFDAAYYGAIPDDYYVDGVVKGQFTVTDISTAEVVTVSATHNYAVGDIVSFSGTTSTPSDLVLAAGDALAVQLTGVPVAAQGCVTVQLVPV